MLRRYNRNIFIVASVVIFTVGSTYIFSIEGKNRYFHSQQKNIPVTVSTSSYSLSSKQYNLPNALKVVHFSPIFLWQVTPSVSPQPPSFEKTINDPAVVQKLYNAIIVLPQGQKKATSCTFNPKSVTNQLQFFSGSKPILDAAVIVGSCFSYVRIDGSDLRDTDSVFLSLLTKLLGLTKHELYGVGEE